MHPIAVMHVVDTLDAGGAERVAVNLANSLPRETFAAHLCTTRSEGPLAKLVRPEVPRLQLSRSYALDLRALQRMRIYIRDNRISLLHAHGSAVFLSLAAKLVSRRFPVIWHAHYGRLAAEDRPARMHAMAARGLAGVIVVNQELEHWVRRRLRVPGERIWYLPNPVVARDPEMAEPPAAVLPGKLGRRIVCVANLRPEKDHLTLLRAMRLVVEHFPDAQLILVGSASDPGIVGRLEVSVLRCGLQRNVSWIGPQQNVEGILNQCDIGVLSSSTEGLPMALLEYGMAGLAAVSTSVGQCSEVLANGRAGLLVPPSSPESLAAALMQLLGSPDARRLFGESFRRHVTSRYGAAAVVDQLTQLYDRVLSLN
jgi:glycosyltransferase involved in cell wall biosynthesis